MKKFILFTLIFTSFHALKAQQTCATAVSTTPTATCNYSTHTTTGTEYWLKFVASSPTVNISLITVKFGINATHIHNLSLYSGNCSSPVLVADDELPFVADAKELDIDLNASGLIIGQTYYLKASRIPVQVGTTCNKSGCTVNNSTDPTTFDICVQDIDVFIPLDFGLELPSRNHSYTTNRGQLVDLNGNPTPEIKLYSKGSNPSVFIADDKVSYVFSTRDTIFPDTLNPDTMNLYRVDMTLVGANTVAKVFKTEQTPGVENYYLAHIPLGVTKNKSYSRAVCNEVYPKIDMQYYSNNEGLKYYFVVKPGGDADDIIMKFDGATAINVTPTGGLEIVTPIETLDFEPPHAYRINPAGNPVPMPWQAKFEAIPLTSNQVKFKVHNYSANMPLIIQVDRGHSQLQQQAIDNLEWNTYFGGNGEDVGMDVQVDGIDNVYVAGYTGSSNFPNTAGTLVQTSFGGYLDAFVSKFNIASELLWSTYYGGSQEERGLSILPSQDGLVYVTGFTFSTDMPTADNTATSPYIQTFNSGERDAFLFSLNPQGLGSLEWGTYFGGYTKDVFHKVAEDNLGNLILGGSVKIAQDFPPNASIVAGIPSCDVPSGNQGFPVCDPGGGAYFQSNFNGGNFDPMIVKFDSDRKISYSTFFGGSAWDAIWDVVVDKTDNSYYITGFTRNVGTGNNVCNAPNNGGFPMCDPGAGAYYQSTYPGGTISSFVSKFDAGNKLTWSTFFGASNDDTRGHHLALNSIGELYLVGTAETSSSFDLPNVFCGVPTSGFPLCDPGAGAWYRDNDNVDVQKDVFITRFNTNKQITWSTFFGSDGEESNVTSGLSEDGTIDISIDANDRVFIFGNSVIYTTGQDNLFTTAPSGIYLDPTITGTPTTKDAFIAAFDSDNNLFWSTYFGGNSSEWGHGIVFDDSNNKLYITGATYTENTTFPQTCPGTPNPWCVPFASPGTGWLNAFISRFDVPITVGINKDNIDNDGLTLYPNPTNGNILLSIELNSNTDVDIVIYNSIGQLLSNDHYENKSGIFKHTIELDNLSNGIYFVNFSTKDQLISRKIVKN